MGARDAGMETGDTQVVRGPCALDKSGNIVAGGAGFRYIEISDKF